MNLHELEVPILQAPVVGADTVELAAAVSNVGGTGSLGLTWIQADVCVAAVE